MVIPAPTVVHEPTVVTELDDGARDGSELPRIRPGRYRLRIWFLSRSPDELGALSRARAVTAAVPAVSGCGDLEHAVAELATLFERVTPFGLWYQSPGELVEQVAVALGSVGTSS